MKKYFFHKLKKKLLVKKIEIEQQKILNWNENSQLNYGLNRIPRNQQIIVSMTTFSKRLSTIHICLKSLINQSVKADKIIVWLGPDVKKSELTDEMKELVKYGVTYEFVPLDLKPHKKYYYAMKNYPDAIIITVDDDSVYAEDTIESLLTTHEKYPNAVCARRVHYISVEKDKILPYTSWKLDCRDLKKPSYRLIPTGVGGVLYPPQLLSPNVLDVDKLQQLSLMTDDIWLKWMELLNRVPVVWAPCIATQPPVIQSAQEVALYKNNVSKNKNDECINNMMKEYPEVLDLLTK